MCMPCARKVLPIAWGNLLIPAHMLLPFRKGKEDKIFICTTGMFIMWICQWLLSQTRKKNYMRNDEIFVSRYVRKS